MTDHSAKSGRQPEGRQRTSRAISDPALTCDLQQQIAELQQGEAYSSGRNSITLAKYPDFRVVLVAIRAGTSIREHQAAGSISVQTIRGHVRMRVFGQMYDLPQGHLLMLAGNIAHDVEAVKDSAFLLTMGWAEKP